MMQVSSFFSFDSNECLIFFLDFLYDYDTHSSPLHFACMLGTGEVVELLLHSLPYVSTIERRL